MDKVIINRAPTNLSEYIGNEKIKQILALTINACKEKGLHLNHVLVTGQRGTGKTTLATLVAKELGLTYKIVSANAIDRIADLNDLFVNDLPEMLIIDEIHRIKPQFSDLIHSAMDNFEYSYASSDDQNDTGGRIITVRLKPFSLWGLTTDEGMLTPAFYSRFVKRYHLMPYTAFNLQKIVMNVAKNNGIYIDTSGAYEIAIRSNGIPRTAISNLMNVYEYAIKYNKGAVNQTITKTALELHDIDGQGLNQIQREILKILSRSSTPIGATNLCERVGIGVEGLTKIYEPYLLSIGYIKRLQNGRAITLAGRAHLKK